MTLAVLILTAAFLFVACQWIDHKTKFQQPAWLIYLFPLLLLILTYGLRDNWFQDYAVYESVYRNPQFDDDYEILFVVINNAMRGVGMPLWGAMSVYAGFCIIGTFVLFLRKREYTGVAMAVFAFLSIYFIGMLIRWAMGCGLVFVGFSLLDKKRYIPAALFFLAATLIHTPLIIMVVIGVLIYYFRPFRNIYINLALLLGSLFITQQQLATFVLEILQHMNFIPSNLHVADYIDNPAIQDKFFEGDNLDIAAGASLIFKLRLFLYYCWFVVFGYIYSRAKQNKLFSFSYNMLVVGAILTFPTMGFELMMRFQIVFEVVGMLIMAKVILDQFRTKQLLFACVSAAYILLNFALTIQTITTEYNIRFINFV